LLILVLLVGDWQRQESESRGKPMTVSLASIQEVLDEIRDALETREQIERSVLQIISDN